MTLTIQRVVHEMHPTRVTDQEGRWYLRHVALDADVSVFLVSERAPAGTVACELKPEALEFLGLGDDGLVLGLVLLPIALLTELMAWPSA